VRNQQSRWRPIGTGDPYSPPPPQAGRPPDSAIGFEAWRRELLLVPLPLQQALQSSFQAISPALALQLAGDQHPSAQELLRTPVQDLSPGQWEGLWRHWQAWLAALETDHFGFTAGGASPYRCWQPPGVAGQPVNAALAAYHRRVLHSRALGQRQQQLQQRLGRALEREQQQWQQQQQLLAQVEQSDGLQRQADALLCLAQPSREQVAEAQNLYKRARKLRRSVAAIEARLALHQQRMEQLEASLTFVGLCGPEDPAGSLSQLEALEQDCQELLLQRHRSRRERGRPDARPPQP
jgi:predicted ribosome quality control (RQC) complex YloA/Tae2 family protein